MSARGLSDALRESLGVGVSKLEPIAGGDVNQAFRIELDDKSQLFVKTRAELVSGMYTWEAEGLHYLRETRALRIPEVRAVGERFLVLEWIASGKRAQNYDEALGRGLAQLHAFGAERFGFGHDNLIASLAQSNRESDSWPRFYAERRLLPLAERARARGLLTSSLHTEIAELCERLESLCGDSEPPARLHGDLWSGNVMSDEHGAPVLVDPSVYAGDREVDLAMLQLFGSPSARFFAAYDEVHPRKAGADERVALYQLYPLLVHVCLFGSSYCSQLARALSHYS